MLVKNILILFYFVTVFPSYGFAWNNKLDDIIRESNKYGDYTKDSYNKNKACEIILKFLEEAKLTKPEKCYAFNHIAKLNSIWAKNSQRNLTLARKYYSKAIEVMGNFINEDVVFARINLVAYIPDKVQKINEMKVLCAWLVSLNLMDDSLFESMVSIRNEENITEKQKNIAIRKLRNMISDQLNLNSKNLIMMVKYEPNAQEYLKQLGKLFLPGFLAYKELNGQGVNMDLLLTPKTPKLHKKLKEDPQEEKVEKISNMIDGWRYATDKEIRDVFDALDKKIYLKQSEKELRICDYAYVATESILYGNRIGYYFFHSTEGERDKKIKERLAWWKIKKTKGLQEIFIEHINLTLDRMKRKILPKRSRKIINNLLGYDFGYMRRVIIQKESSEEIIANALKKWLDLQKKPWREWKDIFAKEAQVEAKEINKLLEEHNRRLVLMQQKKIENMMVKNPEVLDFAENKWPILQKTKIGRQEALKWIQKNEKYWRESVATEEIERLRKKLESEN